MRVGPTEGLASVVACFKTKVNPSLSCRKHGGWVENVVAERINTGGHYMFENIRRLKVLS